MTTSREVSPIGDTTSPVNEQRAVALASSCGEADEETAQHRATSPATVRDEQSRVAALGAAKDRERARLAQLEEVVDGGWALFLQVGAALAEIKRDRLYQLTHKSFAQYVEDRFGMSRTYAYRIIEARNVATEVQDIHPLANEAQARALGRLPRETWRPVLEAAVASGRPVTASVIRAAAAEPIADQAADEIARRYENAVIAVERAVKTVSKLHDLPTFWDDYRFVDERCGRHLEMAARLIDLLLAQLAEGPPDGD